MKILVCPDSFKGTLTSEQVCKCIRIGIESTGEKHEIITLPFADGGEGFSDCMKNICKGHTLYTTCHDIYSRPIEAEYTAFGDTAVIECAKASGIQKRKAVMSASSYGTGEMIKSAVSQGFSHIILGLGGSGCCDGGAGALTALGADFYDENYKKFSVIKGGDLNYIFGAGYRSIVKGINFTYACDVENILFGENGAAYVFAPQKGANKTQVKELDEGLKRLNAFLPRDVGGIRGGGAAGGICAGLYSVYGGEIKSGFDILSDYAHLEEKICGCDLVVTGEGKSDSQTLMGKLPYKISLLASKYKKRCVVISGIIDGVSFGDKMISLADRVITAEQAMQNAENILIQKAKYILQ